VSALLHRERTGQGQLVEVAMLEVAVMALASAIGVFMDGDTAVPPRTGNRHPALAMAPYNVQHGRPLFFVNLKAVVKSTAFDGGWLRERSGRRRRAGAGCWQSTVGRSMSGAVTFAACASTAGGATSGC
jgi:hypothetical protein